MAAKKVIQAINEIEMLIAKSKLEVLLRHEKEGRNVTIEKEQLEIEIIVRKELSDKMK